MGGDMTITSTGTGAVPSSGHCWPWASTGEAKANAPASTVRTSHDRTLSAFSGAAGRGHGRDWLLREDPAWGRT